MFRTRTPNEWPFPWPQTYPWDYAWLIPVGVAIVKKGAEVVGAVCDEARQKGKEHGKELAKHV